MRNFVFVILFISLSCGKEQKRIGIKKGFLNEIATYNLNGQKEVLIKNIGDGERIFAIINHRGKILYQQPINILFNDYHYWVLYADENANVYFYNSDYSEQKALIWNPLLKNYSEVDFCAEKINLPLEFEKELKSKATFRNCKSIAY